MTAKEAGPPGDAIPPQVIANRYQVVRELGRGGMATVFLCIDTRDGTHVAVKVLRPELGSAVVVERFLREIAFASELDHPQIPKVLDSGVEGDVPFYVMTFVSGESLRYQLDKAKQLPIDEAIRIARLVCKPTAYAHSRGIVHRDLKPANILISSDNVYVLDFGVARALLASAEESLTSTGIAVGTPAYMSPEQALADDDLDARSDIYSLACVIYEMIAGIPPFVGATAQAVMARRFVASPPPLYESREAVPDSVETAIAKALSRSPADRWQTVDEFAAALAVDSPYSTLQTRKIALERKRKRNSFIAAGAVIATLGAGGIAWTAANRDYVGRAQSAIGRWDFSEARAQLEKAVEKRPDDPRAQLWLAELKMIQGEPAADWRRLALRAADRSGELKGDEKQRAAALVALVDESSDDPCRGFERVAAGNPQGPAGFTATLALASCLASDKKVVRDASSPGGFRFRASMHRAANLYQGLAARYSANEAAYSFLVPHLETILWTNKNKLRQGMLAGESERTFLAWQQLIGDTLAFIPVAIGGSGPVRDDAESVDRAVDRNLLTLQALATAWTSVAPGNPDAHETLARMLETTGNLDGAPPSALREIRIARNAMASIRMVDGEQYLRRLKLGSANVRMLLKLHRFADAAAAADSIVDLPAPAKLSDSIQTSVNRFVTGLSSLTGHPRRITEMQSRFADEKRVRLNSGEERKLGGDVGSDLSRLETYAAFGAPRDSILMLIGNISQNLSAVVPAGQVEEMRTAVLTESIRWAAPAIGPAPAATLGPTNDLFGKALKALAAKDIQRARAYADSMANLYSTRAPGEVTMDAVLQYAWLRATVGDTARSIQFLDNSLRGLSRAPQSMLMSASIPAALVRAMILRADLAARTGDGATADRWSGAARQLWKGGDPEIVALLK